jgi:hypothetical protein
MTQDTRFIQVQPLLWRNTYVLCPVIFVLIEDEIDFSLGFYEMYDLSSRGPFSLLIYSGGGGLQVKCLIWYYYNV